MSIITYEAQADALNKLLYSRDYYSSHEDYPLEDWKYLVANDDTRMGYWEWVIDQIEAAKEQK